MTKITNFNKWPENMFVCLKKHLPRPLVETGPCDHLASFGKPEKAKKNSLATKIPGLKNILMAKVCSELAREQCQSSLGACLFGVCSEFARSSFGVCPQTQAQSAKIRAEFGLQHNAFCSYRRGGFIVKFFPESSSSPFLLAAKTHFCLDDPKPLSACASSCLTLKFFLVLNRIPHANWQNQQSKPPIRGKRREVVSPYLHNPCHILFFKYREVVCTLCTSKAQQKLS